MPQPIVQFERDALAQALGAVSAAQIDSEMGWVQFHFDGNGHAIVFATGPILTIRYLFSVQHEGSGGFTILGRQISEYVKQLPQGCTIKMQFESDGRISLRAGRSHAKMSLVESDFMAELHIPDAGTHLRCKGDFLERWVESFKEVVQVDDPRGYTNGACIWTEDVDSHAVLHAVASDSYRLGKVKLTEGVEFIKKDGSSALLPRKTLEEIRRVCAADAGKMFDVRWSQENGFFSLESDNYYLLSKLISYDYPSYVSAVPKNIRLKTACDKNALLESMRRAMLFADKNKTVKLKFDGPMLEVSSSTGVMKEGEEFVELLAPVSEPIEVKYNGTLFLSVMALLNGNQIHFEWDELTRPVKITGEQERGIESFYLLVATRS